MKVLSFTTLYPNAAWPNHGIFIENRLRRLAAVGGVELRVVAPCPWFPFPSPLFGDWARWARAPRRERRHGIAVEHPRYLLPPRIGMTPAPLLLALGARRAIAGLAADGFDFDLLDAHYLYPDGVAAVILGRWLGRPVVLTARGSDATHLPRFAVPRRAIAWALRRAAGLAAVSDSLRQALIGLGAPGEAVRVLRNGVDLDLFRPAADRGAMRAGLGLDGPALLHVGHLVPLKNQALVVRSLPLLPDATLLLAGDGPERPALARLAAELGVAGRVRFLGEVPHAELPAWYAAVDLVTLTSTREGWPNVLLEAMACGTPVLAAPVGGVSEVVGAPEAGLILDAATPEAVAGAARRLLARPPPRRAVRAYAEGFSWEATTRGQVEHFRSVLDRG